MRIFYFGSMTIGRPNGPGLNERDFVEDLSTYEDLCLRVYAPIEADITLQLKSSDVVRRVLSSPLIREFQAAIYFLIDFYLYGVKPDLLVFRVGQLPIMQCGLILFCRFFKIPTHVKTVGIGTCKISQKRDVINRLNFCFFKHIFQKVTSLDTPTSVAKREIANVFNLPEHKIVMIGNGAREITPPDCRETRGSTVCFGYVGRFPLIRGGRQVIESVARATEVGLGAYGLITGTEDETTELRQLASSLQIIDRIDFVGLVPQKEVAGLLCRIDIGFSIVEGVEGTAGQKLRQYLMHGCCAVFSNDEFMEALDEDFIIPFTSACALIDVVKDERWRKEVLGRKKIHEWAKENVAYQSFNALRRQHFLLLHNG